MDTKEKLDKLNDSDFQMYLGVKRKTFYAALEILEKKSGLPCSSLIKIVADSGREAI